MVHPGTRPDSRHTGNDYTRLKTLIAGAGPLQKQPGFPVLLIGVTAAALLVLCFIGFAMLRNPWLQALDAVTLAIGSAQLGFHLHDAGHHQMFVGK